VNASGKVVLVSGACQGYGPAISRLFAQRGATVAVHDLQLDANNLTSELVAAGFNSFAAHADPTDAVAVQRMVDEVYRQAGRLDALVTIAEPVRYGALLGVSQEEWLDTFQRNVHGAFYAIQAAAKYMLLDRRGRIVSVTALAGTYPGRAQAAFAASNGALHALTKALAVELGAKQIAINSVAPGAAPNGPVAGEQVPLQRTTLPDDVAELVLLLASEDASYVTGEIFYVDGGLGGRH
jgi:NAD(P)-dependent dehydrogenase (short-subunit alcohol dehydrogenase family)